MAKHLWENKEVIAHIQDRAMLCTAIEPAGHIVGKMLDSTIPRDTLSKSNAEQLSKAFHALNGTYYKVTGKPLKWREGE